MQRSDQPDRPRRRRPLLVGGKKVACRDHETIVNAVLSDIQFVLTNLVLCDPNVSDPMLDMAGRSVGMVIVAGVLQQLTIDDMAQFIAATSQAFISSLLPKVISRARAEAIGEKASPALLN